MQHASQTSFGMAEPCALPPVDKWDILAALTKAAPGFGLSHRTLSVLKALMTFLPGQMIAAERGSTVVFPSNRTLSERLNGMPESTLRRHLAKLVEMGIVSRQDSPNRKRYARRLGAERALAYGFDLSPLAVHAAQVESAASQATLCAERIRILRDRLSCLRQTILASALPLDAPHGDLLETARLTLRRRSSEETLTDLIAELEQIAAEIPPAPSVEKPLQPGDQTIKMSGSDNRNERHIQYSNRNESDSERSDPKSSTAQTETDEQDNETDLQQVLTACNEFRQYYPATIKSWTDLITSASHLAPMIGIELPVYTEAQRSMGTRTAATIILCILERLRDIRSPGAYLRRLSQKARAGQFSITPVIAALGRRRKLSADNFPEPSQIGNTVPA